MQSDRRRPGGSHRPNGANARIFRSSKWSLNGEPKEEVRIALAAFLHREPPRRRRSANCMVTAQVFSTFSAFFGFEVRNTSRPFFAPGLVAQ